MPGLLAGWLVLMGIGAGSALLGPPKAWDRVDPTVGRSHYAPDPDRYEVWVAAAPVVISSRRGACEVRVYALTSRRKPVRVVLGGVEQNLDTAWSQWYVVPENRRLVVAGEFIDPTGGGGLACHTAEVLCLPGLESAISREQRIQAGSCPADRPTTSPKHQGRP